MTEATAIPGLPSPHDDALLVCQEPSGIRAVPVEHASTYAGRALTVHARVSPTDGPAAILSWGGAGERVGFRLWTAEEGGTVMLQFELETDWNHPRNSRPLRVGVPVSRIGAGALHDVVARFGGAKLDLFVDGVLVDEEWPVGAFKPAAGRPILIGWTTGQVEAPAAFPSVMRVVALWNRSLADDEIVAMSGGPAAVARRAEEMLGPQSPALIYWKPRGHNTSVGDCMPFYHEGRFHLFYLFDRRHHGSKWGLGAHQHAHASSTDLVNWEHHPLAVPVDREWEGSICTGSVFFHRGTYYSFYSARKHDGTPGQLSASTSRDGIHFAKGDPLFTPKAPYEPVSARDPNVFREAETGLFHMLVTTWIVNPRVPGRGGCLAHLVSRDLATWEQQEPIFLPGLRGQPECPDWFAWNDWYYLFYGIEGVTRYRMSRQPLGPWMRPRSDIVDCPQSYVMKTAAFAGNRRIGAAWIGEGGWGGQTVFREILQNPDGTLESAWVPEMIPASGKPIPLSCQPLTPGVAATGGGIAIDAPTGFAAAEAAGMPRSFHLHACVTPRAESAAFGLVVRGSGRCSQGWELRMEPFRQKVGWRPCGSSTAEERERSALYQVEGIDRSFALEVLVIDDLLDVCVDGRRTLIHRMDPVLEGDRLCLFAHCGKVSIESLEVRPLVR